MHTDLSPHLHSTECNLIIEELKKCHSENKFAKFLGICNDLDRQMIVCLRNERKTRQKLNREKALEKQKRVQQLMREHQG
ncbi:COX assembly mitochondrial protein 2 homolog [Anopheles arabiensis]|uniref:COX assembly mitochondrial protein n=1 Tax=Anopheles quadriannulatus TaxID=34691 RepID=A0A182XI26_ANOQN|nr:COX assembly mitochondrial protein 2 homolog [Anopheles arabiensis]XP_040226322.1 COX assembly mitochondrial protein 2 homolog [Anopheles coluzzii]XP_041764929.1 COX assembly mitochondrial protein 2 homolog [Anopheles merus]XP_312490.3 COX assembly mitochondrial protein 2 homolog [Anopheles gambiae]